MKTVRCFYLISKIGSSFRLGLSCHAFLDIRAARIPGPSPRVLPLCRTACAAQSARVTLWRCSLRAFVRGENPLRTAPPPLLPHPRSSNRTHSLAAVAGALSRRCGAIFASGTSQRCRSSQCRPRAIVCLTDRTSAAACASLSVHPPSSHGATGGGRSCSRVRRALQARAQPWASSVMRLHPM